MLTLDNLKEMEPGKIFAQGEISDSEHGLNMTGSGKLLRWVAVRGDIEDWAIYCHWADHSYVWIKELGDKVHSKENIQKVVPCTEEAFRMYRH